MARKKRRRDASAIANRRLPVVVDFDALRQLDIYNFLKPPPLTQIEDRRLWHPEGEFRPARMFNSPRHRLVEYGVRVRSARSSGSSVRSTRRLRPIVAFADPSNVLVCARREMRRQVMHAFRRTGRGGGPKKRPTFSWYSRISCKKGRR